MTSFQSNNGAPMQQYMVPMFGRQAKGFGQQFIPQGSAFTPQSGMPQMEQGENPFYLAWLRQFGGRPSIMNQE